MIEKIYRLPKVIELTGMSRSSIYIGINNGTFPKPIKIGHRSIGWPEHYIQEWQNKKWEPNS